MKEEISFVARRYRKGRFDTTQAWGRFGIGPSLIRRRLRVAAAIASVVALSAVAAVVYHQYAPTREDASAQTLQPVEQTAMPASRMIDFEDTPLPEVITKIQEVYGVEVTDLPENATRYHLSLHYEGTASDLVETINEILDTHMKVKQ